MVPSVFIYSRYHPEPTYTITIFSLEENGKVYTGCTSLILDGEVLWFIAGQGHDRVAITGPHSIHRELHTSKVDKSSPSP